MHTYMRFEALNAERLQAERGVQIRFQRAPNKTITLLVLKREKNDSISNYLYYILDLGNILVQTSSVPMLILR